jgi:2-dehydropantoate 2-reductase
MQHGEQVTDSVLIAGTGALACLFAARLADTGVRVTLLGTWPEGQEALRSQGVRLVESDGSERASPVEVVTGPSGCKSFAFALVLVKSWQTQRAARQLAGYLSAKGVALTLQNGLGNRETLVEHLGAPRVALGVTTYGATLEEPGRVRLGGTGIISLGEHPRLAPLVGFLTKAGFVVELVDDVDSLLWSKLVINAAINPLTALLQVSNGELLNRPESRRLLASAVGEAAEVAAACGQRLTYADPVAAAELVAFQTANNTSSMLQDVLRGAPTEIDAICGAIVSAGEKCNIPVPVNRVLWLLVKALVHQER